GWVDHNHRMHEAAYLPARPCLEEQFRTWDQPISPMIFCTRRRAIVHATIMQVSAYRGYLVHALNVRTNHVHVVLSAAGAPEPVMTTLKAWATRRLVEAGMVRAGEKVWARHGSTRYLWTREAMEAACRYVDEGQGEKITSECPLPYGRGSD